MNVRECRVLPRLRTKVEWVGVVWAEFVTFGIIHERKSSMEGMGGHSGSAGENAGMIPV